MFADSDFCALFPDIEDDTDAAACLVRAQEEPAVAGECGDDEARTRDEENDLAFLCLNLNMPPWERLETRAADNMGALRPCVHAFLRQLGREGDEWKRWLSFLRPYGVSLMRDSILPFALNNNIYTYLLQRQTVVAYVEAWLVYSNVKVLVEEVETRYEGTDANTRGLACAMAHDMYQNAMFRALHGPRKRAVWFYDVKSRKAPRTTAPRARGCTPARRGGRAPKAVAGRAALHTCAW